MGYQLMAAALQPEWARQLTPREQLVLVVMCQLALDEARGGYPPGYYFAGRDHLIIATEGNDFRDNPRARAAARRAVERALQKLRSVGAIHQVVQAKSGRRSEYLVTPHVRRLPVDNHVPDTVPGLAQADIGVGLRPT